LCRAPDGGEHDQGHDKNLTPENLGSGQDWPLLSARIVTDPALKGRQEEIGWCRGVSCYCAQMPDGLRAQARACALSSNRSFRSTAWLRPLVDQAGVPMTVSRARN